MATNVAIQSNTITPNGSAKVRGSDGTLYVGYWKSPNTFYIAYSFDSGISWNISSSTVTNCTATSGTIAIDSADTIHLVYKDSSDNKGKYQTFTNFTFTLVNTFDAGSIQGNIAIAIDASDNPNIVYTDNSANFVYRKYSGGAWSASTTLIGTPGAGIGVVHPQIVIDYLGNIMVTGQQQAAGFGIATIAAIRYSGGWGASHGFDSTNVSNNENGLVVDSSNNVYVIYNRSGTMRYSIFNTGTVSWSAPASITTTNSVNGDVTAGIDSSDVITALWNGGSDARDIMMFQYTGSWGSDSVVLNGANPDTFQNPQTKTPVFPKVGGLYTNIWTANWDLNYVNANGFTVFYYSNSANYPAPTNNNYSRESSGSLPSTDAALSNLFTTTEYGEVAAQDNVYADQTATNQYAIFQFKNTNQNNTDPIAVTWIGKSNIAPSHSSVLLQIYNRNTPAWETLATDSSSSSGVNFTLTGTQSSNLSHYYDGSNTVSCRVYQLAT